MNDVIFDLLKKLIPCRTVTKDAAAVNRACAILKAELESRHLFVREEFCQDRTVLYASCLQEDTSPLLLLNAHLDTVPAASEEQYVPVIRDGKLCARGTNDCLGNVAAIAAFLYENAGKNSVGAVFSTDEETGGLTSKYMVEKGYGKQSKLILIMDNPTRNAGIAQKGILVVKLTARGRGGHSSEPWTLDNPIVTLMRGALNVQDAWSNPTAEAQWSNSFAPCIVAGGSVENQVPDTASLIVNIRYTKSSDRETIPVWLQQVSGLSVEVLHSCEPVEARTDFPAVKAFERAVKTVTGHTIAYEKMNGATDARFFASTGNPVVMRGVYGEGEHSGCEWAEIASFDETLAILRELVKSLQEL